jgi:hypothetical protein
MFLAQPLVLLGLLMLMGGAMMLLARWTYFFSVTAKPQFNRLPALVGVAAADHPVSRLLAGTKTLGYIVGIPSK